MNLRPPATTPIGKGAFLAALFATLAACRSERITTIDVPIEAASTRVWSGGTLVLRSSAFEAADTLPCVRIGAETLAVQTFGRDSVLVQLPDTTGVITLSVTLRNGASKTVDAVTAHGFVSAGFGPRLDGTPYPWPGNGAPTALAYQDGRLVLINYRYGTALPLLADTGVGPPCAEGPIPSPTEPGLVTTASRQGGCGPLIAAPVAPGAAAPDTGPPPQHYWSAMQLGRGHWLVNNKYFCSLLARAPAGGLDTVAFNIPACDEMSGFAISPRGDRVVPFQAYGVAGGTPGIPVFEPAGPSVAYTLPLNEIGGVAFSEVGDTVFAAAADSAGRAMVFAADAVSGRILATKTLASGAASYTTASSVALDPGRPWLYVADQQNGQPYIDVFDRTSLSRVATLRVPPGAMQLDPLQVEMFDIYVIVLSPVERRLYLTFNYAAANASLPGPSRATYVLQFDLLP